NKQSALPVESAVNGNVNQPPPFVETKKAKAMKFDELLFSYLGEFGRYQKIQFVLVCLPTIFAAMHALSWTFTAAHLPHRCRLEDETSNVTYWTSSNLLYPVNCTKVDGSRCPYEECRLGAAHTCPHGYVFDFSEIEHSAINRWEIVCERSVLKAVIQSAYYVGQMAGSLIFGYLGDRWGRKKVFFMAIVLQLSAGVLMAIVPSWAAFGLLRAAVGFSHPGIFVIAVVIGMELVGPSKRKLAGVISGIFFAIGQVILGTLAYFIRNYQYLQLAISLPAAVFFVYWWLVPESARWLISQRRFSEADKILQRAARMNGSKLPERWWEQLDISDRKLSAAGNRKTEKKYSFLDLVRTPRLRMLTMACFFLWPVVSMVYYGVSMKTDFLGGSFYGTFIIGGFSEIPALLIIYFLVDRVGRKAILAGGYFIAAFCMLSNLLLPAGSHWVLSVLQFLVTKASITSCYAVIYTITPELFPTVIRNTAMGCCSTIARIGAITASYIAMWIVERVGAWAMIIPFGSLALAAGIVVILLIPETMGRPLPETIEEIEQKQSVYNDEMVAISTARDEKSAE
uniref:Major facilitator superfamily (MFS) profile domain-containing protein n=5 Tax=Parascaris univalens TaxID=6257 RepID=A0A914ZH12_PARUN